MAGPIASLFIKLGLDASGVEQGAAKAQAAIGGITKGNVIRAAAAGLATGLGFASKASMEMEDRAARFRAETGASADEAQRFAEYVNAASGKSVLGLDKISDTATKVRTDMGLVGDEMAAQTDRFLAYERATSQGAEAVVAYDDILDAWDLTAADTAKVMDTLIASHQAYGGAVSADQDALAKLAPVLRGANMDWQDAVALMNAGKASGLDAAEMVPALTKALSQVESPEQLRDLMDQLAAIPDDGARAAKAMDLFGTRGGLKLAQALANGGLERYRMDMADVAGATQAAADALDDTFRVKLEKALNLGTSLIRGFGMQVGPVLTGAMAGVNILAALGIDKTSLSKVWKVIAGNKAVTAAAAAAGAIGGRAYAAGAAVAGKLSGVLTAGWDKLGGIAGGRFMTAFKGVALLAMGAIIVEGLQRIAAIREENTKLAGDINRNVDDFLAGMPSRAEVEARLAGLQTAKDQLSDVQKGIMAVGDIGRGNILGSAFDLLGGQNPAAVAADQKDRLEAYLRALPPVAAPAAEDAGAEVGKDLAAGIGKGLRLATRTAGSIAFGAVDLSAVEGAFDAAGKRVKGGTAKIRAALRSGLEGAASAADAGMRAIETAMAKPPKLISFRKRMAMFDKAARTAWRNMRRAVKANDPVNAAYWQQQYMEVRDGQRALRGTTTKTMADIKDEMRVAGYAIPREIGAGVRDAKGKLRTLGQVDGSTWGEHAGETFAAGLRSTAPEVGRAAQILANKVHGSIGFSSPPRTGPLKDIRSWGPHMVEQWARGTEGALPRVEKAAMAWAKAAEPSMGGPTAAAYAGTERATRAHRGLRDRRAGGDVHLHVGTLIANDAGIDALRRRMDRRGRLRRRDRRVPDSPNAQER